jgi:hypothetical protein
MSDPQPTDEEVECYRASLGMTEKLVNNRNLVSFRYSKEPAVALRIVQLKKKESMLPIEEFQDAMSALVEQHKEQIRIHIKNKRAADALKAKHEQERFAALEEERRQHQQWADPDAGDQGDDTANEPAAKKHKKRKKSTNSLFSPPSPVKALSEYTKQELLQHIEDTFPPTVGYVVLVVHHTPLMYPQDRYILELHEESLLADIDDKLKHCSCKLDAVFWNGLIRKHKVEHVHITTAKEQNTTTGRINFNLPNMALDNTAWRTLFWSK